MINSNSFRQDEYLNTVLRGFNPDEIVELAEQFSGGGNQRQDVANKILKQIQANLDNEFNATEVFGSLKKKVDKKEQKEQKFDYNASNAIRIIEKTDSSINERSYVNELMNENHAHIQKVTNNEDVDLLN